MTKLADDKCLHGKPVATECRACVSLYAALDENSRLKESLKIATEALEQIGRTKSFTFEDDADEANQWYGIAVERRIAAIVAWEKITGAQFVEFIKERTTE